MTIISIEGASGVGKSTICGLLEQNHGFMRIPEVNELFSRPLQESPGWYFDRQIERWKMARHVSANGGLAVLDGDPFQPVWYNWIFDELGFQPLPIVLDYFQRNVENGSLGFPDRYYVLTAAEWELRKRKEADIHRPRRNFEKHLRLIGPQLSYFSTMNESAPGMVKLIDSTDPGIVTSAIADDLPLLKREAKNDQVFARLRSFIELEHSKSEHRDR